MNVNKLSKKEIKEACTLANGNTPFKDSSFDKFRDNEEVVKTALSNYWSNEFKDVYDSMSERLKNDKPFLIDIVDNLDSKILRVSDTLKNDKEYILSQFDKGNTETLHLGLDYLNNDKERMLKHCSKNPSATYVVSDSLKDDKEFMTAIISSKNSWGGTELQHASDRLKDDTEFVQFCVNHETIKTGSDNGMKYNVIEHASPRLKELCQDKDPIRALESCMYAEKLQSELSHKQNQALTKKIKI